MQRQLQPQERPIRVVLISQLRLLRASLRYVLENAGITLVGEAASWEDELIGAAAARADVIILDLDCRPASAEAVAEPLLRTDCRVIALATPGCPHIHQTAIQFGARGLVLKDEPSDVLVKTVRKVYAGEAWLDRGNPAGTVRRPRPREAEDAEAAKIATLTAREREIISRIGEGLKNKAIARRLFISEATVRNHLTSILGKLDLSDRFELVVYAFRHRLVD